MRAAAQVDKIPLAVQRNHFASRNGRDDFRLVFLTEPPKECHRFIAVHLGARHRQPGACQLLHALLDGCEILGRERALIGKIVIEAILDHRPDGDLRIRKQTLDGLGQQMGAGMADDFEAVRIPGGNDLQAYIAIDDMAGVDQPAIDSAGQGSFGQTGADAGSNRSYGHRGGKFAKAAIRQSDARHEPYSNCQWWPTPKAT